MKSRGADLGCDGQRPRALLIFRDTPFRVRAKPLKNGGKSPSSIDADEENDFREIAQ